MGFSILLFTSEYDEFKKMLWHHTEPRLNATLTFTLHDKTTSNATNFWLFFDVAYVSPFKFCSVMSYQQQQRDMYATCDTYATIFRRLNATFFRTLLLCPLVKNLAREARPHESGAWLAVCFFMVFLVFNWFYAFFRQHILCIGVKPI